MEVHALRVSDPRPLSTPACVTVEVTSDPNPGPWAGVRACGRVHKPALLLAETVRLRQKERAPRGNEEVTTHIADQFGDKESEAGCRGFSGMPHSLFLHYCRATERQALGSHGKAFYPECPEALEPLCNRWWISKEGRQQV